MAKVTTKLKLWPGTIDIQERLREIVRTEEGRPRHAFEEAPFSLSRDIKVVVSERAVGKSTGLVLFIAERILTTPERRKIAVVSPTENLSRMFQIEYNTHFPTLREPYIMHADAVRFEGRQFDEVYLDEVFLFNRERLNTLAMSVPIVAGVGTISHPETITLRA